MAKSNFLIVLSALLIMLFCGGTIYARTSVDITNHFQTGVVDISITEYEKDGDEEEKWKDNPTILPADTISKIPRIHNEGCDCYVRAKITVQGIEGIDESNLFGIETDWVKADDGYYYYTEVLSVDESVDLFQGVWISEDFPQENQGKTFSMDIDVDAIQSRNFTPLFETAAPWGNIEIIDCKKEGLYEISSFRQSDTQNFQIRYEGDSQKLIANSEDFFANIPYLMPGDQYGDSIRFVNEGKENVKIYFRSAAWEECELSDKIRLKISMNRNGKEELVYLGNLKAADLTEDMILAIIPKGEVAVLDFEIGVPSELNNQYSLWNSSVTWIFSTEPIKTVSTKPVQTGDTAKIAGYAGILVFALTGCVAFYMKRRKERVEEHEA